MEADDAGPVRDTERSRMRFRLVEQTCVLRYVPKNQAVLEASFHNFGTLNIG